MVNIFLSSKKFREFILNDKDNAWQMMMYYLKRVYIDQEVEMPLEEEDPIYLFDKMYGSDGAITFDASKSEYIKALDSIPSRVLEEPCGIFILDIDEVSAKKIQDDYGVICQSLHALDHSVLTKKSSNTTLLPIENRKSWNLVFRKFKNSPINSILIIDRHLFDNDSDFKHVGLDNLFDILDNTLPSNFDDKEKRYNEKEKFCVGVFLGYKTTQYNKIIATKINKLKKDLNRPYPIDMEVYFFHPSYHDTYSDVHNRRILTNSYVLNAEYKLAALNKSGKGTKFQNISVTPLFSLIHIDPDPEEDLKAKSLMYELEIFNEYVSKQIDKNVYGGEIFKNGQKLESFKKISHRFLNHKIIRIMKERIINNVRARLEQENIKSGIQRNVNANTKKFWIAEAIEKFPHNDERGTFGLEGILAGNGSKENPFSFDIYISTWFKGDSGDYTEERGKADLEYLKKLFPNLTFEYPHKARFKGKLTDYKWSIDQEEETINQIVFDWLKWQGEIEKAVKIKDESQTDNGEEEK